MIIIRLFIKQIIKGIALILAIPFIILGYLGILTSRYNDVSVFLGLFPFLIGEYVRYFYYKATLNKIGKEVVFKFGSFCQYHDIYIGNKVVFGPYNAIGRIKTGDNILIGGFVNILSGLHQHSFSNPKLKINQQKGIENMRISIGSNVWIGSNSVIGNNVGNNCVIGAGSIIIKKLKSNGVYAGNPARFIKNLK